ncbi:MAG: phosphoglycerate mutase family protein [Patescibacteria group bacterium]|nr:phosphoglycerate mutase family protein [Patescibacteria group bacterium]
MKIFFLRHAHSLANENNVVSSKLPGTGLSEMGIFQAKELADQLLGITDDIKKIYCSPFYRAIETLKYANLQTPYVIDERIKELDYGIFDGKKIEEVTESINNTMCWVRAGDNGVKFGETGENQRELISRVYSFLKDVISANENVLVITHECIISIIARLHRKINNYEKKLKINNAEIIELIFEPTDVALIDKELKQYA